MVVQDEAMITLDKRKRESTGVSVQGSEQGVVEEYPGNLKVSKLGERRVGRRSVLPKHQADMDVGTLGCGSRGCEVESVVVTVVPEAHGEAEAVIVVIIPKAHSDLVEATIVVVTSRAVRLRL